MLGRRKRLIEAVQVAIQGYNIHRRALKQGWLGNHRADHFALIYENQILTLA